MRALLVTSAVTFVPENYNQLILKLAEHPSIVGLVILENRDSSIIKKALSLVLTGLAPRTGLQLLKNYFGSSNKKREDTYKALGKKVWYLSTINGPEALSLIKNENIDLVVNSRTRYIFKKEILSAPRLGCINVHHGLLPEQRGVMCDLWAHYDNEPFGFSVHVMTPKLDDGEILKVQTVQSAGKNYLESIYQGSKLEAEVLYSLLTEISQNGSFQGTPNQSEKKKYRRNPTLKEIIAIKRKGIYL